MFVERTPRVPKRATRPGRLVLDKKIDVKPQPPRDVALGEIARDLIGPIAGEKQHPFEAEPRRFKQEIFEKRPACDCEQGFRHIRGERAEPRAEAADENHALLRRAHP